MALYGLLEVLQARNETPQTFTVDVYVNGALAGTHTFTPASLTAPDPDRRLGARHAKAPTASAWSRRAAARSTGRRARPTTTRRARQARSGSRQLAITRKYARLVPVRQKDRIVYREQPFDGRMNPGDVLTRAHHGRRIEGLALSDDRRSAAGRRRSDSGHDGLSDGARGPLALVVGIAGRVSRQPHRVLPGATSTTAATSSSIW